VPTQVHRPVRVRECVYVLRCAVLCCAVLGIRACVAAGLQAVHKRAYRWRHSGVCACVLRPAAASDMSWTCALRAAVCITICAQMCAGVAVCVMICVQMCAGRCCLHQSASVGACGHVRLHPVCFGAGHVSAHVHRRARPHMHLCASTRMHTRTCIHTCVRTHTHAVHTHTHTHTHTDASTLTPSLIHMCTHISMVCAGCSGSPEGKAGSSSSVPASHDPCARCAQAPASCQAGRQVRAGVAQASFDCTGLVERIQILGSLRIFSRCFSSGWFVKHTRALVRFSLYLALKSDTTAACSLWPSPCTHICSVPSTTSVPALPLRKPSQHKHTTTAA